MPEADNVHRQHRRVQEDNWPQAAAVAVADKGDVAGDSEKPKRQHLPGAKRREHETRRQPAKKIVKGWHRLKPILERNRFL